LAKINENVNNSSRHFSNFKISKNITKTTKNHSN